ncbi:MAG TPA: hypothetical protein PLL55_00610, partial [Candidatus Aminicenantes bacterium]|nr:hypothetical protein [Candidatus Aminicenantes bacterium]
MSFLPLTEKARRLGACLALVLFSAAAGSVSAQSLDIPSKKWGLSFGNSKEFTGLRFNFRDHGVVRITGVNVTLWTPRTLGEEDDSTVTGLSLGLIPGAGRMRGVQLGLLGVAGNRSIVGVSAGLLGVGAGEDISGFNFGGLGVGAGGSVAGINLGGLGVGAGENVLGINIGGLGVGAGKNVTGINIGGLGVGAGERLAGISIS